MKELKNARTEFHLGMIRNLSDDTPESMKERIMATFEKEYNNFIKEYCQVSKHYYIWLRIQVNVDMEVSKILKGMK